MAKLARVFITFGSQLRPKRMRSVSLIQASRTSPPPAKEDYDRGMSLVDAALSAARLRFRPLMMTALAFIVGCVPLWIASGAGSVARQIIGTTVIGGMLAETFIGRFFVPAIFYVVEKFSGAEKRKALPLAPAEAPSLGD
jgi:hydrophobic/amphiphilic exporter-1 (mainly G- bacteria), HAE1 family